MKIYTKTGDKGGTSLYGGVKVSKNNVRIEAYGTVDELNSAIGLIRSGKISDEMNRQLIKIQKNLFHLGAELATPQEKMYMANGNCRLPKILIEEDIVLLENWIDEMNEELPPLTHFILSGGNMETAHAHLCRCICRRAERRTVALAEIEEIRGETVKYLNRLSDYLFVVARTIAHDAGYEEIKWLPNEE
ncbi:MAG: cob(I)yrinic acid a,c-diamide adenosyltransferase [Weeksellaceae bacterium]|nr:cob(I)yrinic acid a,c-diamide adenosyltransferase [Weeksellaceae bacterium]